MSAATFSKELESNKEKILNESVLFELSIVPQVVVNKERRIIRVNRRFSTLFGYEPREILGQKTLILTPLAEKFDEYETYFCQTKEGVVVDKELLCRHKNGDLFWVKLEGVMFGAKAEEYFVIWSFTNIDKEVKYREELKMLASADPLSGLYNRRFFLEMAVGILELAKRQKRAVSLILLDVDNFKSINDTYGHALGDETIVKLSEMLKKRTRQSDVLCRYGGEEFVLLLPETCLQGAVKIAESLRVEFQKCTYIFAQKRVHFTASFGVSTLDVALESALEDAIKKADNALYRAKKLGKNRVEIG